MDEGTATGGGVELNLMWQHLKINNLGHTMFTGWEGVRVLKARLGSSQRLAHNICARKWDAKTPGRAGPLEILGTFTAKAVK